MNNIISNTSLYTKYVQLHAPYLMGSWLYTRTIIEHKHTYTHTHVIYTIVYRSGTHREGSTDMRQWSWRWRQQSCNAMVAAEGPHCVQPSTSWSSHRGQSEWQSQSLQHTKQIILCRTPWSRPSGRSDKQSFLQWVVGLVCVVDQTCITGGLAWMYMYMYMY